MNAVMVAILDNPKNIHRKKSFHQNSDIQQGDLEYANNHMIKCGMMSMMVRISQ